MHESASDIAAAICLAISAFAASLVPWLWWVNAEHLLPAWVRATPAAIRAAVEQAPLTFAATLLLLSAPEGAAR
ncbi:hypothetical protein [Streptomyces lasiicapitis]|uniref:hypothetical protein n=1 Tax=Streptomyces lasiicapitis TaxID=1923961 RepID=UPI003660C0C6